MHAAATQNHASGARWERTEEALTRLFLKVQEQQEQKTRLTVIKKQLLQEEREAEEEVLRSPGENIKETTARDATDAGAVAPKARGSCVTQRSTCARLITVNAPLPLLVTVHPRTPPLLPAPHLHPHLACLWQSQAATVSGYGGREEADRSHVTTVENHCDWISKPTAGIVWLTGRG